MYLCITGFAKPFPPHFSSNFLTLGCFICSPNDCFSLYFSCVIWIFGNNKQRWRPGLSLHHQYAVSIGQREGWELQSCPASKEERVQNALTLLPTKPEPFFLLVFLLQSLPALTAFLPLWEIFVLLLLSLQSPALCQIQPRSPSKSLSSHSLFLLPLSQLSQFFLFNH